MAVLSLNRNKAVSPFRRAPLGPAGSKLQEPQLGKLLVVDSNPVTFSFLVFLVCGYVCVQVYMHVCGARRTTLTAISWVLSTLFVETRSLIKLELTKYSRLG